MEPSNKSYAIAVALSGVFGVMGLHHFYLRRDTEGMLDFSLFVATIYFYASGQIGFAVLCFIADGLHTFIITIMLLTGSFKDGEGKTVCYPGQKMTQGELNT